MDHEFIRRCLLHLRSLVGGHAAQAHADQMWIFRIHERVKEIEREHLRQLEQFASRVARGAR